ncbi:protein COFACTOR ASSEMBLY OF COMPLEX C SUBUNIT B CCB3, chloroplastic [Alnus glutinosa]|uniref:protein COFACTOR ASSEMBLY OF COMPLEX C SUBUNIT B CCB3, chloroplastic n=1 Tax=Alnus glutinosa TaxID=3517 RepID=UPI002D7A2843|nr:protein COFACTOR ASSEMBLY OF COMPLEX C SUBUNIT B CCB3, chloroplastic [Alnus glutinosa]
MATCSQLLNCFQIKGRPALSSNRGHFHVSENLRCPTKRKSQLARCSSYFREIVSFPSNELPKIDAYLSGEPFDAHAVVDILKIDVPGTSSHGVLDFMQRLVVVADLDPATAKIAIGFLGPFLSIFGFLFIVRIVMSWYPKLPVGKFPFVIAYAPTEPLLIPARKLIPPLGGVDVTPVVWFGLISFLSEILVGRQGLLVILSQQVG